jgi:exosortase A-associated hydrolase 1
VIVVGGPQYRIGSHRQFLSLARRLAADGIPAMRFDYRGMGDSGGAFRGFEHIGDDIRAAVDAFVARQPQVEEIVLWGLCDAASAILFYAHSDPRVVGSVLLNPWVRTESGHAKAQLKHYYVERLFGREMWTKIATGKFDFADSLRSLRGAFAKAFSRSSAPSNGGGADADDGNLALPDRMARGLARFGGKVMLIVSGRDLTAREFEDAAAASPQWRELLRSEKVTRHDLPAADHTYSRREWQEQVARWTVDWIRSL